MGKEPVKVLTESMFYVLLALLQQEHCGIEIVEFVDEITEGRVPPGPGTLYTILGKLRDEGRGPHCGDRRGGPQAHLRHHGAGAGHMYRRELNRLRLCLADGERAGREPAKVIHMEQA